MLEFADSLFRLIGMASSRQSNEAHWWASEFHYGNILAGTRMDVPKRTIRWLLHAALRRCFLSSEVGMYEVVDLDSRYMYFKYAKTQHQRYAELGWV